MKIWIDILTPKQLVFFEPIIAKLEKKHQILCTSRQYQEISNLAKIRGLKLRIIGKHGGKEKSKKLDSSLIRMSKLRKLIQKYSPDITISFVSPEAARISFGLGIFHISFCDSPHANAVMRLTIPLIQKLLIPWIIPKKEFTKFGIQEKDIIKYHSIDAAVTIKRKTQTYKTPFTKKPGKNILFRIEEEKASYALKSNLSITLLKEITNHFPNYNIVVLTRYKEQFNKLNKIFGNRVKILEMQYDGINLLKESDIFIGSGGTMTAESALLGIPTVSYHGVPNIVEEYLAKKQLLIIESNAKKMIKLIEKFSKYQSTFKTRAKKIREKMEDPFNILENTFQNYHQGTKKNRKYH